MTAPINAGTDCSRSGAALSRCSPLFSSLLHSSLKRYSNGGFTHTHIHMYTDEACSLQLLLLRAQLCVRVCVCVLIRFITASHIHAMSCLKINLTNTIDRHLKLVLYFNIQCACTHTHAYIYIHSCLSSYSIKHSAVIWQLQHFLASLQFDLIKQISAGSSERQKRGVKREVWIEREAEQKHSKKRWL